MCSILSVIWNFIFILDCSSLSQIFFFLIHFDLPGIFFSFFYILSAHCLAHRIGQNLACSKTNKESNVFRIRHGCVISQLRDVIWNKKLLAIKTSGPILSLSFAIPFSFSFSSFAMWIHWKFIRKQFREHFKLVANPIHNINNKSCVSAAKTNVSKKTYVQPSSPAYICLQRTNDFILCFCMNIVPLTQLTFTNGTKKKMLCPG